MPATLSFDRAPHALRYMSGALLQSTRWRPEAGLPPLVLRWRGYTLDAADHDDFARLTGIGATPADAGVSIVFPQVTAFRLSMALLTHPRWPLPIWRTLQVRNRLRQRRILHLGERFDAETTVAAWRVLGKGVEVDLCTRLLVGADWVWEAVVTFYHRGRFGPAFAGSPLPGAPDPAPAAAPDATTCTMDCARWRADGDGRWRFGALTGDYNGIHQWSAYARWFGFPAASAHPQRIAAACLARLGGGGVSALDLWIRGPVCYQRGLVLRRAGSGAGADVFALWVDGDPRAALIGAPGH